MSVLFSKSIPDRALQSPNTQCFVDVLDRLQMFKQTQMATALRFYNPALCTSAKWLANAAADYGFTGISEDYPILPIQQMLLNADVIRRLCGSRLGLQVLISAATLGEVTIDDSHFIRENPLIFLNSPREGFVTAANNTPVFYLCDNNDYMQHTTLNITVESKYFNDYNENDPTPEQVAIRDFLESFIREFIGFSSTADIFWTFAGREEFYYHELLNNYYHGSN